MQTLTQLEYLDRDTIMSGVVDWIVKESPLTGILPQKQIEGNAYKYNVSLTLPTASWLGVGDQIVESTGTFEPRYADIYTLIQNSNTDKSKKKTNATQDPEAVDITLGAQAMAHEFEKTLIIGQTSVDSTTKQFKGILKIIAEFESSTTTDLDGAGNNSQVIAVDATSGAVTQIYMDTLIDQIKPGKPSFLLMSRRARRKLNALARASGSSGLMVTDSALFGIKMSHYDEVPIYVSDWLLDNFQNGDGSSVLDITAYDFNTTRTTDYDNTIIIAAQLGEKQLVALHAGEMEHERETFLEDYNAVCNRFVWYCGLACFSKFSMACLININPDS